MEIQWSVLLMEMQWNALLIDLQWNVWLVENWNRYGMFSRWKCNVLQCLVNGNAVECLLTASDQSTCNGMTSQWKLGKAMSDNRSVTEMWSMEMQRNAWMHG